MASTMNLEQILEAIRSIPRPSEGGEGHRTEELVEALRDRGMSQSSILRAIKQGLKAGTVRRSTRWIECMNGRVAPVTSYVFLEADPVPAKRGTKR